MAVDRSRQVAVASVFTYQPKIGELSNKIAQSLPDDFLTRQQKHIEKQRQLLELALPPALRRVKLAPITKRKAAPSTNELFTETSENENTESPDNDQEPMTSKQQSPNNQTQPQIPKDPENKVHQMISSSPYSKDPIVVKKRHQSKPDTQRTSISKSIGAVDAIVTARRERSASPSPLRPSRSRTMPSFTASTANGKPQREQTSCTLDRLQRAHELVERAINEKKIFCIAGTYYALREALRERGWVEKFCFAHGGSITSTSMANGNHKSNSVHRSKARATDSSDSDDDDDGDDDGDDEGEDKNRIPPWEEDNGFYGMMSRMLKNYLPNFVFTTKTSTIDYKMLQKEQIVNHYGKNSCLTTKNGLCVNLRNLPWYEPVDPNVFFPRCYKISTDDEKQDFIDDFRISACQGVIKWILEKFEPPRPPKSRPSTSTDSRPSSVAEKSSPTQSSDQPSQQDPLVANNIPPSAPAPAPPPPPPPAPPAAPRQPSAATRQQNGNNSNNIISSKLVDIAVEQCEKYLTEREHGFIDVLREPNTLSDAQWDQFLSWYYQLVHNHGRLQTIAHSLDKLRSLAQRLEAVHSQFCMDGCRNIWIVKPGAKSRGRGVQCYARLDEIIKLVSSAVMKEGKYVVQKYIERPLLIYDTKFDIRQWFLVTDWNPLTMWFYEDCYLRFCSQLFTLEKFDESVHLSNNSIQCNYSNAKERSSRLPDQNMWTSDTFKDYLKNELGCPRVWNEVIYPGMKNAVIYALEACQDIIAPRKNSFELFGADFMLTEDFQPLLIEVNCSPCLAASTTVTSKMCPQVQEDLLKVVLDRRFDKNCNIGRFEMAYRQQMVSAPNYLGLSLAIEGQNCGMMASYHREQRNRRNIHSATSRRVKAAPSFQVTQPLRSASASPGPSESDSDSDENTSSDQPAHQSVRQRKSLPASLRKKGESNANAASWNPVPRATMRRQNSRQNKKIENFGEITNELAQHLPNKRKLYYLYDSNRRNAINSNNNFPNRIPHLPSNATVVMQAPNVLLPTHQQKHARNNGGKAENGNNNNTINTRRHRRISAQLLQVGDDLQVPLAMAIRSEDDYLVSSLPGDDANAMAPRMLLPLRSHHHNGGNNNRSSRNVFPRPMLTGSSASLMQQVVSKNASSSSTLLTISSSSIESSSILSPTDNLQQFQQQQQQLGIRPVLSLTAATVAVASAERNKSLQHQQSQSSVATSQQILPEVVPAIIKGLAETIYEEDCADVLISDVMCYQPDDDNAAVIMDDDDENNDAVSLPDPSSSSPAAAAAAKNKNKLATTSAVSHHSSSSASASPSLHFKSFKINRPKEHRPELPGSIHNSSHVARNRGQLNATIAASTAANNKQTVANIMTYHPPLPHRRPRTFLSYSSFLPSRTISGPMFISQNALENILSRAKNLCVSAGVPNNNQSSASSSATPSATSTMDSKHMLALADGIVTSRAEGVGVVLGEDDSSVIDQQQYALFGDNQMNKYYTFPKRKLRKAKQVRHSIGGDDERFFTPVKTVALTFQTTAKRF